MSERAGRARFAEAEPKRPGCTMHFRLQHRTRNSPLVPLVVAMSVAACVAERDETELGGGWVPPGEDEDVNDDGGEATDGGEDTGTDPGDPGDGDATDDDGGSTSEDPLPPETGDDDTTDGGEQDDDEYTGPYPAERKRCVEMSNEFRQQMGIPLLQRYAEKEECVDEQAKQESMIDTPHGKLGLCGELRQNHGDGTGWEPMELLEWLLNDQFNEGPGGPHYEQMLDPNMTRVACGFYQNPNGNFWINIDFW